MADKTGTSSWIILAVLVSILRTTLYQSTYPKPEVTAPLKKENQNPDGLIWISSGIKKAKTAINTTE